MNTLEGLKEAIAARLPVTFRYLREGKTYDSRRGNPHAVFILRLKGGGEEVCTHVVQTGGATDSGQELPSFRQFFLNDVVIDVLHREAGPFEIDERYTPESYEFPIAKV